MKTTMIMQSIANPQRTTLAHLVDASELHPVRPAAKSVAELPQNTANPQRTTLIDAPVS